MGIQPGIMAKEGNMNPLTNVFDYNQMKVYLIPKTRSIRIVLQQEYLNKEMLFELESIFNWLSAHPEINSCVLQNSGNIFCSGWDSHELLNMNDKKHCQILGRLQKLVVGMFYLPQTIVVDLGEGASGLGAELALGADFRVARNGARIHFCPLSEGRVNTCGGVGILESIVPAHFARQWNLIAEPIPAEQLIYSGLVYQFYSSADSTINQMLEKFNQQSPVARIQTKRSLLEGIRHKLESLKNREFHFANAALAQRDWQEALLAKNDKREPSFCSVKELSTTLKEKEKAVAR